MQFVVFKHQSDKVDVYINNKLTKQIATNDFINYRGTSLNIALYEFISANPTLEKCNIRGEVTITSYNETDYNKVVIGVGSKKHTTTFNKAGTDAFEFYCGVIKYITKTLDDFQYERLFEKKIFREVINSIEGSDVAATLDDDSPKPTILKRLINFNLVNLDYWESGKFNIYGEIVSYIITKSTNEIVQNVLKAKKEDDDGVYTLKRFSLVNGTSSNIISTNEYIHILAKEAEEDLLKRIIKNCKNEHTRNLLNALICIISTIDEIINFKTYDDNELYDYIKLREYICNFIEYYTEVTNINTNWYDGIIRKIFRKERNSKHYIDKIEKYLMVLLLVETQKQEVGNATSKIPSLLSSVLKTLEYSR